LIDCNKISWGYNGKTFHDFIVNANTDPGPLSKMLTKELGLTTEEAAALTYYLGYGSRILNRELRNKKKLFCYRRCIQGLDSALKKLRNTDGDSVYCHSNPIDINEEFSFYENKLNKKVCFPTFISSSKTKHFAGRENYSLVIEIKIAKESFAVDVESLYKRSEVRNAEREVLFPRNSFFKIVKVDRTSDVQILIHECTDFDIQLRKGLMTIFELPNWFLQKIINSEKNSLWD